VLRAVARRGLAVSGLAEFRHEALDSKAADGIVVNYSNVSDSAWDGALNALCAALSP
jgi:GntR family transcriptional regulator/MocR family aminotransferase